MKKTWQNVGRFRGIINPVYDTPRLRALLEKIPELCSGKEATLLQAGRHRTVRLKLDVGQNEKLDVVVKLFGKQKIFKDLCDKLNGSKALRTYAATLHLVNHNIGATPPVACLERWKGPVLKESAFISLYMGNAKCCKDLLIDLYNNDKQYANLDKVVASMAHGIRKLHDSGFMHCDLGNQNIFFTPNSDNGEYTEALFLDLNRAKFSEHPLSLPQRAKDTARIALPTMMVDKFIEYYWDNKIPTGFIIKRKLFRFIFKLNEKTRKFRHPIREMRYRLDPEKAPSSSDYPEDDKMWIWNSESARPVRLFTEKEMLSMLDKAYGKELTQSPALPKPEAVKDKQPSDSVSNCAKTTRRLIIRAATSAEEDLVRLNASQTNKALIRFAYSEEKQTTEKLLQKAKHLKDSGIDIAITIAQAPEFAKSGFDKYVEGILKETRKYSTWISIGQGLNSLAWAIRSAQEADRLIQYGKKLLQDNINTVATVIDSPISQIGSASLRRIFDQNDEYTAYALSRNGTTQGDILKDAKTIYTMQQSANKKPIVIISEAPWETNRDSVSRIVHEICAPEFTEQKQGE